MLETLATARDISVILLSIEIFVLLAIPLAALYFITRGLRNLLRQARPFLHHIVAQGLMGLGYVERALVAIARPFIWLHARYAALSAFCERMRRPAARVPAARISAVQVPGVGIKEVRVGH